MPIDPNTSPDHALIAAHGSNDWDRLSELHETAADLLTSPEEVRFHLTQAWVFALVSGNDLRTDSLERRLRKMGGL